MVISTLKNKLRGENKTEVDLDFVERVRDRLIKEEPELVVSGLMNFEAREKLKVILLKQEGLKKNEELVDYIIQETVGLGVIDEILMYDDSVTDIGFNGSDLVIETNEEKYKYDGVTEITEDYIIRIIQKFANAVGKEFTPKQPILDAVLGNLRLNAVHGVNSPYGTTMSIRVVNPVLALNENNFEFFAPKFMLEFFRDAVMSKCNIAIAGEVGTGKTEFQKLLFSFIDFDDKAIMIEDVQESHVKELFPEKDVYSWVTDETIRIETLVKASLRNNPRWIMVAETRGSEAYEMLQAVMSGHYLITSLHSADARTIPKRLVNMAKMGYDVNAETMELDVRNYMHLGVFIKMKKFNGRKIRYLAEVVEFNPNGDTTIFSQSFRRGEYKYKTGKLSEELKDRFDDSDRPFVFPENKEGSRVIQ